MDSESLSTRFQGSPRLFRLCLRWTSGDLADAEDLLADARLRVLEAYSGHDRIAKPESFFAAVINNLGRDRFRHACRWRVQRGDGAETLLRRLPAASPSCEQLFLVKERLRQAARRFDRLTASQRTAILLRSEGSEYSTIAQALHTSEVNARKLVETGRRALLASGRRTRHLKAGAPP